MIDLTNRSYCLILASGNDKLLENWQGVLSEIRSEVVKNLAQLRLTYLFHPDVMVLVDDALPGLGKKNLSGMLNQFANAKIIVMTSLLQNASKRGELVA